MIQLRILSYNIHSGYDWRGRRGLRRINQLLEDLDIDIAVFQEMETRPKQGGLAEDVDTIAGVERPYHLPGPTLKEDCGWYGNLLVSRYPITRALVHDLETHKVLEPRNAIDAVINTPLGRIRIIGTHLSLSSHVRWSEINNLIHLVDEVEDETLYPLFLIGDLNEWRRSSKLISHLDNLMTPAPCGKSFPSFCPFFRLDRVWHDAPSLKINARTVTEGPVKTLSDHLPVLLEISTPNRMTD